MSEKIKVAIAAGGTAGHINPALALGEKLREQGVEVVFVGQPQKLEGELVPQAGFELIPIKVSGLDRSRPWTAITALWQMRKAERLLARYFQEHGWPQVAAGFGAYVELALLKLCKKRRIPYILHEQNSVPGLANKLLTKDASVLAYAFPQAKEKLQALAGPDTHFVYTGNPVRKEIGSVSKQTAKRALGIKPNEKLLLVFGGSLGAASINEGMRANIEALLEAEPTLRVLHATGKEAYESYVLSAPKDVRYRVVPYVSNMSEALGAADLVLSRSGASTIAELIAAKKPALLIPYPLATEDHQNTNADYLVEAGCAIKLQDGQIKTEAFQKMLRTLLEAPQKLDALHAAYDKLGMTDAADALAEQVLRLV